MDERLAYQRRSMQVGRLLLCEFLIVVSVETSDKGRMLTL
jgi:hypothetical protein